MSFSFHKANWRVDADDERGATSVSCMVMPYRNVCIEAS